VLRDILEGLLDTVDVDVVLSQPVHDIVVDVRHLLAGVEARPILIGVEIHFLDCWHTGFGNGVCFVQDVAGLLHCLSVSRVVHVDFNLLAQGHYLKREDGAVGHSGSAKSHRVLEEPHQQIGAHLELVPKTEFLLGFHSRLLVLHFEMLPNIDLIPSLSLLPYQPSHSSSKLCD
jgi:hypothetical protein